MSYAQNIAELLASIDMSNNGYLFAPSQAEIELACKHKDVVTVERGNIKRCKTVIEYYPDPVKHATPRFDPLNDYDYEGAILARQERLGMYD